MSGREGPEPTPSVWNSCFMMCLGIALIIVALTYATRRWG
jgi:hypothetical protein